MTMTAGEPEQFSFLDQSLIGHFIPVESRLPDSSGDYIVKIRRDDTERLARKRLFLSPTSHAWMGGCRPFSENDVVLAWFLPLGTQTASG